MIDIINLADIDIREMELIKETYLFDNEQDHSRWIFKCAGNNLIKNCDKLYLKIWNPSYIRRDNILNAINSGFYDENTTPALKAVINHNGLCRGYVMDKCHPDLTLTLNEKFYALVKDKSVKTKFFHAQFSPCHVMKYKKFYSLIDLEGVFPLSDLYEIYKQKSYFDYAEYERFIIDEHKKLIENCEYKQYSENMKNSNYFRKIHPLLRICQSTLAQLVNSSTVADGKYLNMIEY